MGLHPWLVALEVATLRVPSAIAAAEPLRRLDPDVLRIWEGGDIQAGHRCAFPAREKPPGYMENPTLCGIFRAFGA